MIEIVRPVDRAAWLAARSQDVTASVAAAVLNAHPYTTQYRLWAEKTGRSSPDDDEPTDAMKRGVYLEPVGVAMLRDEQPAWTVEYYADNTYYRDPACRIGATPDAFATAPGRPGRGCVQIKSTTEDAFRQYWLDPDTHEVVPPTWIALQAITEARLTDCAWACVAVVVITWRGTLRLHVVDIPLRERHWSALRTAVAEFWRVAASGEEPPVDWERDGSTVLDVYREVELDRRDLTADAELDRLAAQYRRSSAERAAHQKICDSIKPRIIHALGNSAAGLTASFEITAIAQERAAYVAKASSSRVLRIKDRKDILHAASF